MRSALAGDMQSLARMIARLKRKEIGHTETKQQKLEDAERRPANSFNSADQIVSIVGETGQTEGMAVTGAMKDDPHTKTADVTGKENGSRDVPVVDQLQESVHGSSYHEHCHDVTVTDQRVVLEGGSDAPSQQGQAWHYHDHDECRSQSDSHFDSDNYDPNSDGTTAEASRSSSDGALRIDKHVQTSPGISSPPARTVSRAEMVQQMTEDHPDVMQDINHLSVDELTLDGSSVHAKVSLDTCVGNLVQMSVRMETTVEPVKLSMKGVNAQALLVVRLNKVRSIVEKTVSAMEENPMLRGAVDNIHKPESGSRGGNSDGDGGGETCPKRDTMPCEATCHVSCEKNSSERI